MDVSTFLPYLIQIAEYVYDIYNYNIALTIDEIYDQLSMLINVDKYVVYLAIEYMIREKYKLMHNGIDGHIIYNNNYYIFQPFNKVDQSIPVIYRISGNKTHKKYQELIKSKKTFKKYNTPDLNENVEIDPSPSLKKHKLIKLYDFDDRILYYYDIERLSFTQKASLIKETILKLPKLTKIDEYVFEHYRNNFIYKTDEYEFDKEYSKDVKPVGFYLYTNQTYVYFLFDENDQIYEVDEVTNDEFNGILKEYAKTSEYIKKYKINPPVWGYNYIPPKKIVPAIDFKIVKWFDIKDKNKKIIDGGSSVINAIVIVNFLIQIYTLDLIKTYFSDYLNLELDGKKKHINRIWSNPLEWWNEKRTREAINNFNSKYNKNYKNNLNILQISLIMLPNKTLQLVTEYDTVQILNNNEIKYLTKNLF